MNTFQLQCFLAVANALSFARAADMMNVSQPAITHQIQALESELSTKLFRRSTRLVELTLDGQAFISYAQKIVETEQQAKLRFCTPAERPIEILSIGTSSHTLFSDLEPILAELSTQHPKLHPKLYVSTHERLFHMLDNDSVHVAFGFQELAPKREHMIFSPLYKTRVVCIGKPDMVENDILSTERLTHSSIIIHDPVLWSSEGLSLKMGLAGARNRSNVHFSDSVLASIALARAGYGLAVLPEIYTRHCEDLTVYSLPDAPELTFGLFYNGLNRDDVMKEFINLVHKASSAQT